MGLLERRMIHPCRNKEGKPGEDAQKHNDHEQTIAAIPRSELDRPFEEQSASDAQKNHGDTRGNLPCHLELVFLIPTDILRRTCRHLRHCMGIRLFIGGVRSSVAGSEISRHKVIERTAENLTHLKKLVELRRRPLSLPLRDALARYTKKHGQLLLSHIALGAQMLKVVAETHYGASLSSPGRSAAAPPDVRIDLAGTKKSKVARTAILPTAGTQMSKIQATKKRPTVARRR